MTGRDPRKLAPCWQCLAQVALTGPLLMAWHVYAKWRDNRDFMGQLTRASGSAKRIEEIVNVGKRIGATKPPTG